MNRINVSLQQSIITLVERGWSKRRIARELQLDRATVTRQLLAKANAATNPPVSAQGVTVRTNSVPVPYRLRLSGQTKAPVPASLLGYRHERLPIAHRLRSGRSVSAPPLKRGRFLDA